MAGTRHLAYLKFRVLKIKTADNSFEYILTNLPHSFSMNDIRDCYHCRLGCETSFRYLKHAVGLLHFHAKKPEYLLQKLYSTFTMNNFGVFLANAVAAEYEKKKKKPNNKYCYSIAFSTAIKQSRDYFRRRTDQNPVDIIKLLCRFVHAVKEK